MKLQSLLLCAALSLASPALAQITNPQPWNLLNNASASGPVVSPVGGSYQLSLSGTFGGTSISFVEVSPSGQSFTLAGPYTSALSTPLCVTIPAGYTVQARVTGGAPSALQSILGGIGTGACTPSSGGSAATVNQGAPNAGGNQAWPVATPTPITSSTDHAVIAVTGTAVQFPSHASLQNGVGPCFIVAAGSNKVSVGGSNTVTNPQSVPFGSSDVGIYESNGQGYAQNVSNSNAIWINGTAGDGIQCGFN